MADKDGFQLSDDMVADYNKNGCTLVRGLLNAEEVTRLRAAVEHQDGVRQYVCGLDDETGRKARLSLWFQPGDDVTGMVARCDKVVSPIERLLEGEVYHYHTKLMMKNSRVVDGKRVEGGSHVWHQDYGYWYDNNFIFPDMMTVFIPIDPCTQENGCLQVMPSSHKCGRIEHQLIGGQRGANLGRVQMLQDNGFEVKYVEMEPGDALFFHCNLLHKSNRNDTDTRRWAFLVAYNKVSNKAVKDPEKSQYRPLVKVPSTAILECPTFVDLTNKDFLDPRTALTIKYEEEENSIFH